MTDPDQQSPASSDSASSDPADVKPPAQVNPPAPLASGFDAPAAPGFAAPQVPGYAPPPAPGFAPPSAPGYSAAPLPGSPAAPPAGYPAAPPAGYPGQQYAPARPRTGTVAWALGFLIFIPIPILGTVAAGIAMPAMFGSASKGSDVARANARSAANWGLTYLLASVVLLITHIVLVISLGGSEGMRGFYPIGIAITLYFAISILHIVLTIMGTVRAAQGKVLKVPFAIPYIKA